MQHKNEDALSKCQRERNSYRRRLNKAQKQVEAIEFALGVLRGAIAQVDVYPCLRPIITLQYVKERLDSMLDKIKADKKGSRRK